MYRVVHKDQDSNLELNLSVSIFLEHPVNKLFSIIVDYSIDDKQMVL